MPTPDATGIGTLEPTSKPHRRWIAGVLAAVVHSTQIRLIREHLQEEAAKFRAGDFDDPAAIHGKEIPGLAKLREGAMDGRITVVYAELVDGASLRYTRTDPDLVDGTHSWFAAQTMDHG